MASQVLGLARFGMHGEVLGRADHEHADIRADRHGDHVFGNQPATAHSGIETLANDLVEAVVGIQFHADVGVLGEKWLDGRPKYRSDSELVGSDTDSAGRLVTQLTEGLQPGFDLFQGRADDGQQTLTRLGRCNVAGGAGQQADAETCLQRANGLAQGGLRYAQFARRPSETAGTSDCHEGIQVIQVFGSHSLARLMCSFGF
ncbi:hypothetical protein D9M69_507200 [compost metagenome]